ncbi:MAG: MFS transporter [Mycobacteriales bacterium]
MSLPQRSVFRSGSSDADSTIRTVLAASFIGTTIEWYDFFLYGTASALVFNKLFFPSISPANGVLAAFATFAVGYASRPIGGLVFGHFGDRVGRKRMLVLSLLIMGIGTLVIGLLPTYDSIGVLAPVLLVSMRLFQGIGIGGEWGGAVLLAVEHAPPGRRGLFGSWPQMGVPAGLLLSTVVYRLVQGTTTESSFLAWGWRIPFLLSSVLVVVGLVVRLKVAESPAFERVRSTGTEVRMPLMDVLKAYPARIMIGMGMRAAENVIFPVYTVFILTYGKRLGVPQGTLLTGVIISSVIGLISIPFWAILSDRYGRRLVYLSGAMFSAVFAFPFFALVSTRAAALIWLAMVLGVNVGHNLMYGPQAAFFAELFGTRVRYSGASIVYQVTGVFTGGLAPLIAAVLLGAAGQRYLFIAAYVAGVSLITCVAAYLSPDTRGQDIEQDPAQQPIRSRIRSHGAVEV